MEKIHHQHIKQAERAGVQLISEPEYNRVVAFWPAHNLRIYGADARYAIQQMTAAQKVIKENAGDDIKIVNDPTSPWNVKIIRNGQELAGTMTPIMWAQEELMDHIPMEEYPGETSGPNSPILVAKLTGIEEVVEEELAEGDDGVSANESTRGLWERTGLREVPPQFVEDKNPLTINGVPTNGRAAHQKGFAVVDNPFPNEEGDPDYDRWESEWEESAAEALDEKPEEEQPEAKPGSVVKTKYRAIYAERGHPTHCGDALAVALNNLVLDGSRCNIEYFKMIMDANNVDMSKYRTSGNGWQGRYRMTGRNKLAKQVHSAGGVLKLPNGMEMQMPADWMAAQRFK